MRLTYYFTAVFLLLCSITNVQLYSAEQPLSMMDSQLELYLASFINLPMQTREQRLLKFELAANYYSAYYNAKNERPAVLDQLIAAFRADPDLLQFCKDRLINLFIRQSLPDLNAINFLLDVIAPDLQVGQVLMGLRERMPFSRQYPTLGRDAAQTNSALAGTFAYIATRLIVGGAEEGYAQQMREHIQGHQNCLNTFGLSARVNFDDQMREAFSYFIAKLKLMGINRNSLERLHELIATLTPGNLTRRRLSQEGLDNLAMQFTGLSTW